MAPLTSNALGREAAASEVREAMQAYADAHAVDAMLRELLRLLVQEQPLDPLEFLADQARRSEALDALERKCAAQRFDLRRDKTKRALALGLFRRLLALQARAHAASDGRCLARSFLEQQLRADDTRALLRELFPRHCRDLAQRLAASEAHDMDADAFVAACLDVLASKASVS